MANNEIKDNGMLPFKINEKVALEKSLFTNENVFFDEEKHTYTLVRENKELPSVTTVLSKLGVAPSYDEVDEEVLKNAASYGKAIHKEIEEYIKFGEMGVSVELSNFIKWLNNSPYLVIGSEVVVNNNYLAGTLDLLLYNEDTEKLAIMDLKTTSVIHKESVKWQNSLYRRMVVSPLGEHIDTNLVGHFQKNGEFEVVELPFISDEIINEVMKQLSTGEELHIPMIILNEYQLSEIQELLVAIKKHEDLIKSYNTQIDKYKEKVIKAMEENGISKYEDDMIRITYVAPVTKVSVDGAKLKKELPNIASKYQKITTTKASVRMTLKEDDDNE